MFNPIVTTFLDAIQDGRQRATHVVWPPACDI
jgi:hypothetical protein